ncbi:nose resistant to fluoxetine protein 6 [Plakobranchus ocellatus]|uniref:Nose resistant to fluoxetine protein 6 n=1 Tax=Plakobranchus ocellatus TaxID=259542 RepID=A0AAV3Y298_9GAST|nr:nose resistant to fluoxetine protein 6 [Plakobranchus ocellatus]
MLGVLKRWREQGWGGDLTDIQNYILIKPYCRMAPYIIGLLLGHIVTSRGVFRLPRLLVAAGWLVCATAGIATIFGVYRSYSHHHLITVSGAAVYNALKDVSFGLCVAWVIFACLTGNGGFINTFLSWSVFVPLSRLSYLIYLVHIPLIYVFIFSLEGAMTMTEWTLVSFRL